MQRVYLRVCVCLCENARPGDIVSMDHGPTHILKDG